MNILSPLARESESTDTSTVYDALAALETIEESSEFTPTGQGGMCYYPIDTDTFESQLQSAIGLTLRGDYTTQVHKQTNSEEDKSWITTTSERTEEAVNTLYTISQELASYGYGDRILTVVFPITKYSMQGLLVFNWKTKKYYFYIPGDDEDRDIEAEFRLLSEIEKFVATERDESKWYPIERAEQQLPWEHYSTTERY